MAEEDITVLPVAVGGAVNSTELNLIAASADDIITVSNFQSLNSVKDDLVSKICAGEFSSGSGIGEIHNLFIERLFDHLLFCHAE